MKLKTLVLTVSFVGLPLAAVAAQHETRPGQPAGQRPAAQQDGQAGQARGLVASDAVRGVNVRDNAGQRAGTIDRLVLDPKSGKIEHVILATGGFLGVGRDHVMVNWQDLRLMRDNGSMVAQVDRQRLDQAQTLDRGQFERPAGRADAGRDAMAPRTAPQQPGAAPRDPAMTPPATAPRTERPADAPIAADRTPGAMARDREQAATTLVTADRIEGSRVRDQQRRDLGTVERLMIDPQQGNVRFAIIGTGGFLGVGRDTVLVPWDNIQLAWDGNRMVVDLDQKFLDEAPRAWTGADRDRPDPAAAPRDSDRNRGAQQPGQQQRPQAPATR